ncbi:MAG: NADH-quinone oxidoreductase subunit J [Candidatus Nanopelagicales bacterium]
MSALLHLGGLAADGPVNLAPNTGETVTFWICATLAVFGAAGTVLSRKSVHSALFLALTMINLAILYVAQGAPFLGMVQVIVYTGAVMMLFVFVLMVVGVDASDNLVETIKGQRVWAGLAFLGFLGLVLAGISGALDGTTVVGIDEANAAQGGNIQGIGSLLFTRYLLAFEVTSGLLITAALGAMVLTHRERVEPRKRQPQRSAERFAPGTHPVNKPSPGVYARNNAVDMPAMLPDGSTSAESVPGPLRVRGQVGDADRLALAQAEAQAEAEARGPDLPDPPDEPASATDPQKGPEL